MSIFFKTQLSPLVISVSQYRKGVEMFVVVLNKLKHFLERRLQRRQLKAMDQRMLNDLALSQVDAHRLAGLYPIQSNEEEWRGRTSIGHEKG